LLLAKRRAAKAAAKALVKAVVKAATSTASARRRVLKSLTSEHRPKSTLLPPRKAREAPAKSPTGKGLSCTALILRDDDPTSKEVEEEEVEEEEVV